MKTILFLDIDGVFNILNPADLDERKERWEGCGVLWPVPMGLHLVRAIAADTRFLPVWLSAWDMGAHQWNVRAGTARFAIGYHLRKQQESMALRRFPEYRDARIDRKLIAARYFLRHYPKNPVCWIEDGFAAETLAWARCAPSVRLIDTTEDEVRAALLHGRTERDAQAFVVRYLLNAASDAQIAPATDSLLNPPCQS